MVIVIEQIVPFASMISLSLLLTVSLMEIGYNVSRIFWGLEILAQPVFVNLLMIFVALLAVVSAVEIKLSSQKVSKLFRRFP